VAIRKLQNRRFLSVLVLFTNLFVFRGAAVTPGTLTLAWDPSSDPSVVGYRLYEGIAGQYYTNVMDIGNNLMATVLSLVPGETYYFAVTAYDSSGLESAFSGEIGYTVPSSSPMPPWRGPLLLSRNGSGQAVLNGAGSAGSAYDVLASMDFSSWLVIGTVTADGSGEFQFIDASSLALPGRFYRVRPSNQQAHAP
jgi:hypothetical protein